MVHAFILRTIVLKWLRYIIRLKILFLAEISYPIQCFLISEEVPSISIILNERRSNSLKGFISSKRNLEGNFYTHKPTKGKPTSWSFEKNGTQLNGVAILLKDGKIWHPYQKTIKSYEVNMVIFSGLSSKLSKLTDNRDLLKATSGLFKIGTGCYGGRINKV